MLRAISARKVVDATIAESGLGESDAGVVQAESRKKKMVRKMIGRLSKRQFLQK
jgi:hypothetical protein